MRSSGRTLRDGYERMSNLNKLTTPVDRGNRGVQRRTHHSFSGAEVEVFFDGLEEKIVELIDQSDAVVGCVAWLTSKPILEALSKKPCQIVVQKEDFLRPDKNATKTQIRQRYDALRGFIKYSLVDCLVSTLNIASEERMDAVRCAGEFSTSQKGLSPRNHNKFMVFLRRINDDYAEALQAEKVWTGSYNHSFTATQSFENCVLFHDQRVAKAYLDEWAHIYSLSEELDWENTWVEPQFRIGS